MQDRKQNFRFPLARFAGIAGIILLIGGGTAWWAKSSLEKADQRPVSKNPPLETPATPTTPTTPKSEPVTQPQQEQINIAWLDTAGTNVKLVGKTVSFPQSVEPQQILEAAFEQLLAGPNESAEYTTTIPQGTKLLSVKTTEEGVRVDLSQEFVSGGGSAAMSARLAQVIYTASSLDENTPIWVSVQGQPLENLGGEGIVLSQPITRQEFDANFTL
ncbi:Spore germination protein [Hyella patelloides LEGE 07179]|uniref:Spore germination protein n=1 Tax=Hyella patelloides LEGE 07179 TaxID=945734 RepID=A0A563VMH6_9CYAN|nr:GerMN domain-containing protein [Hyella patelloides]VEP12621.1 Spore germination protein [Hyella patelloides LEGE 07179]